MKKNKKTRRQELLEDRFADLATERKSTLLVPDGLAAEVFKTLGEIKESEAAEASIPALQEKIIDLFKEQRTQAENYISGKE